MIIKDITGPQTASQKLYLQPTDVNAAPVFSGLDNAPTFIQNGSAIVLDPNALLSDPELDLFGASGNWNGAILTLQRDGGANANDVFGFTGSGSTGVNVSGGNLRIGTTDVGTLTNTGGTLAITFNTAATAARVDTVLQAITYRNTDANPGAAVTINYPIDDQNPNAGGSGTAGSGQDQGTGGKLTGTGSITIGINRQVIAEPDSNNINEASSAGDPTTVTGDITPGATNSNDNGGTQDRDPDAGQTIAVQGVVAGGTENAKGTGTNSIASANVGTTVTGTYGSIVINANGTYTYTLDNSNATVNALKPGETLKDSFSYVINDGAGPTQTTAWSVLTITINGQNDPPVATDNVNSVTEDTGTPATGNVRSDGTLDNDPDTLFVDLKLTQIVGNTTETITDGSTSTSGGSVVQGKYGTLTIGADGSYSYALDDSNPAVNALNNGQTLTDEVFTYTLSDGSKTDTATLTITINGHTDGAPNIVANDGNGAGATGQATVFEKGLTSVGDTTETTAGTITVQAPDGIAFVTIGSTTFTVAQLDALSVGSPSGVIDTGEGELRITSISNKVGPASAPTSAEVSYTYTLKARQDHGTAPGTEVSDSIAISVTDRSATPQSANGTLSVQIIDDTPTAVEDVNSITKGAATVTGNAFTNDTIGADGAALAGPVTAITGGGVGSAVTGSYGSITLNADGSYSYALDNTNASVQALQNGQTLTDTFTYTITDKDGDTSTATVTITINGYTPPPPNQVPVAVDDSFTLDEDTPHTGTLIGNDTPSGDGGNVWSKTTDPLHGTVVVNPGGTFTYTPNPDYNGPDSFTYTITDANGDKSTATVTLTVRPVNDVPVAVNDSTTTPKDKPVSGNLAGNDTPSPDGGNVWSKTTDPSHGTVVVNPDGTYTYTPNTGFTGTDTFTYTVTDKDGDKSTATVTIKVGDNGVPVAVNDSTTTPKDKPVSGNLAGNDTPSPDGGNVWSKTTDPSHGTVVVNPDGTYTYTPNEGFTGTDSFTYTITDKDGDKSTATVTVTVGGGVTPPVTPPVNPPVDPTNPPVLPPVIGGPDGPGTPGGPDLPPVIAPVPPVLPSDTLTIDQPVPAGKSPALTLNSPVILDAGPYFANERFDDVRRMVLPFHPIVYVNREVASSQAQRAQDDPRGFSDPSAAVPGERPPVSLGAGLGQDPNLFVSHAIRDSQSVASFLRSTVEGRYSRLGLGSDGYLASPGLFSQPATEISELLKEQRKKLKKAAGEASVAVAENGQGDAPATQPQIARAAGQPDRAAARASGGVAAPSFNEQLRSGAARLPMAARKV